MTVSLASTAQYEASQPRWRLAVFRRSTLTTHVPTGAAAHWPRDGERDATQQPGDRNEVLRSFRRGDGSTWISPTGRG